MNRQRVLELLGRSKPELQARFGVTRPALFGSTARDTAASDSDVDVLVAFDGPATSKRYFGVQFYLEDLLGCPVAGHRKGAAAGAAPLYRTGADQCLMPASGARNPRETADLISPNPHRYRLPTLLSPGEGGPKGRMRFRLPAEAPSRIAEPSPRPPKGEGESLAEDQG